MKRKKENFETAIKCTVIVVMLLIVIFIGMTFLWIMISSYSIDQFNIVLCLCIKNAGSYSVLLVGIVVTTFFQIYSKEKEKEEEEKIKIGEVGYYTLAFRRPDDKYEEVYNGDKIVVEINNETDYEFQPGKQTEYYFHFFTKFLTSKQKSTNLKNIMAFSDEYFEKNKKDILSNYYHYCEKITYPSPLYCSTKPTNELENNEALDRNRYFWLIIKLYERKTIKNFWISAVTEDGILLFVKIKARLTCLENMSQIVLLQQTTYFKSQDELCALYR